MSDTLDQSSIDALLADNVQSAADQPGNDVPKIFSRSMRDPHFSEVKQYDFKRPERVSKDQMRALQTLHESFARNFGASLSGFLRTIIEVKVATCEQMTYSEFISGLPNPTSFNLVVADALEGQMCLEVSPLIVYPIIDRLMGGSSTDLFIPQRPMTLIEMRLISSVTNRGLSALAEAWSGVRKLNFSVASTESNPQLVQIVPPNEVVVVIGFELKMSNRAGTMNLCIPYNVIEPVMEELASQSWFAVKQNNNNQSEQDLGKVVGRAPVMVTGVLAETTISVSDLLAMRPGDLIVTDKPANAPVALWVETERKFMVQIGQFKGNRALKVVRPVQSDDRF